MTEKKREQVEADLRTIIKGSKKSIFVKLTVTELIKTSRRMYQIYNAYKSGEKFKINNDDHNISLLKTIDTDFQNLKIKIKKIPEPLKNLLDRKWESEPNSKHSREGSTSIILKNLSDLHVEFSKNLNLLDNDIQNGKIYNVDPIPIAIVHSSMTIWIEVLKNKDKLNKDLSIFLQKIFDAFACDSDVKSSYKNWQLIKSMN
jgi:hypothetical protein